MVMIIVQSVLNVQTATITSHNPYHALILLICVCLCTTTCLPFSYCSLHTLVMHSVALVDRDIKYLLACASVRKGGIITLQNLDISGSLCTIIGVSHTKSNFVLDDFPINASGLVYFNTATATLSVLWAGT